MPNPSSKPENFSSKIQRIEIQIRDIDLEYIKELLILYFHFKDSPTYPVFVKFDGSYKSTGEAKSQNFRIVEYDEKKDYSTELATIGINPFPTQTVVFIQMFEEGDVEGWEKVTEITREIIAQMEKQEFKIKSVKPAELLPISSLPPWEQIPEHGADREILRFWHEGYTNSEIGERVGKEPLTITNIISRLRRDNSEKIVPKKEAIRRLLRGNKL